MSDIEHLKWIRDRLEFVYDESPNVDYMIKFQSIIDSLDGKESEYKRRIEDLTASRLKIKNDLNDICQVVLAKGGYDE